MKSTEQARRNDENTNSFTFYFLKVFEYWK